jgi:hypothetical protein
MQSSILYNLVRYIIYIFDIDPSKMKVCYIFSQHYEFTKPPGVSWSKNYFTLVQLETYST